MQTIFRGKHFITLEEWSNEEIDTLLDVSYELKRAFAMDLPTEYLPRKTVFLMFFEQSTRTRNSMEAGITQLGGHAHFLDVSNMQIAHGDGEGHGHPADARHHGEPPPSLTCGDGGGLHGAHHQHGGRLTIRRRPSRDLMTTRRSAAGTRGTRCRRSSAPPPQEAHLGAAARSLVP